MLSFLFVFITIFIVFVGIDFVWLGFVAKKFYAVQIGHLMTKDVVWSAAVIFYFIYVSGIYFFAVSPALETKQISIAIRNGALLGLLCYATYDLTNMATLKNWSWSLVLVDVLWGGLLTSMAATAGYWVGTRSF